jgi:aspartyl-tRNA(Asn)/glutamyl-tRNA(Gln) amidotransferase subunit B
MPGVLPSINRAAVEACIKTALALNCEIPRHTKFDRKNYMYPDLPKGYQISQYDLPMSVNGFLEVGERTVRIRRVHLEEDTGRLVHAGDKLHKAWESYVDLNRAGVPLMEIVSEPDIRSADEARDYAMELRSLLRAVGASEAEMEKGQLRAEPNISIRRAGTDALGVKTELKNINSFRALQRAIVYEVERQQKVLESGGAVVQETRGWSEDEERTFSQRSKEFAEDYRYFPEPDLPPLELDRAWIEELRAALPELPSVRRARLLEQLPPAQVAVIGADRDLADLYETAVAKGAPTLSTANWIVNEVAPSGKLPSGNNLAELVNLVGDGSITRDQGREVLMEAVETGRTPAEIVAEHGYKQVSDESELRVIAEAVIDANPKAVADYRRGKTQVANALLNELRKKAPQVNPKVARELLLKLLS